ncbi:uncharacterized protein [Aegilops tauschii subsp. strangulata]|uniref:uncharacterized protein n=1 Tax=Aegilops tauschii subsp. strangulata TaxID=200361 RepID=UPI003CC8B560
MPFGLKNVGATFMRMIQKFLLTQISRNVEAYMDDIMVKSRKVVSDAPLSKIMNNRDATSRVAKWAIEHLPFDIKFEAKKAIKSQALADFLAEWIEQQQPTQIHSEHWTMFFDGSKMLNGSGAGVVLLSPRGDRLSYVLQIHIDSSNNEVEYEALLYVLAISLGVRLLMVYGDLDLVVNHVMKEWDVRNPAMTGYCNAEDPFTEEPPQAKIPTDPTEIEIPAVINLVMEILVITPDWTVPYIAYLLRKELPEDEVEASKAYRAGFYWPRANEAAKEIVERCEGCQFYSNMSHKPASALKTIPLVWPFAIWGLDMIGRLRTGRSGFTHLLIAVNKFTKWIEDKMIKKLDSRTTVKFIKELIFRYGVPHSITRDNGSNFNSEEFRECYASQGTRVDYASVAHPQSNGQAERANGLILQGLKSRLMHDLEHATGAWVIELASVLWGLRTTPNR